MGDYERGQLGKATRRVAKKAIFRFAPRKFTLLNSFYRSASLIRNTHLHMTTICS